MRQRIPLFVKSNAHSLSGSIKRLITINCAVAICLCGILASAKIVDKPSSSHAVRKPDAGKSHVRFDAV